MSRPPIITISDAALARIRVLMNNAPTPAEGFRVSVKKGGCSGYKYDFDYATSIPKGDEIIERDGVKLCVDPAAVLYLIGTELDFIDDPLASRFVFKNPNETARCGCGESFAV